MSDESPPATREEAHGSVDVSVIIPVFNAMPYLTELLESLAAQTLSPTAFEVIAVNDGSTDESGAALDAFARDHANVHVVHQENAGWPGQPRNAGLDLARGRYVFFADADDRFGDEALRRMVEFADENDSDVVIPRMASINDRFVDWPYPMIAVDADLEVVLRSLYPQRLLRRSLVVEFDLRFPEGKIRLEDGMMLTRAYYKARRVSALGDYYYYHFRARSDGQNISKQRLDPVGYTWSIGEVSRLVRENDPDPARADRIILELYRRKCLKMYGPNRFAKMQDAHRDQWIQAHLEHLAEYVPPGLESNLRRPFLDRSQLLRAGDKEGLLTWGLVERGAPLATMVRGRWFFGSMRLELRVELRTWQNRPIELFLQMQDRDSETVTEMPITVVGRASHDDLRSDGIWADRTTILLCSARIPRTMLRRPSKTVIDVFVRRSLRPGSARSRVTMDETTELPKPRRRIRPYETVKGKFSIRIRA